MAIIAGCKKGGFVLLILCLALPVLPALGQGKAPFEAQLAPFNVHVDGQPVSHQIGFRAVLPGENISITLPGSKDTLLLFSNNHKLASGNGTLRWKAPRVPGYTPLTIVREKDKKSLSLQLFVMRPASEVANGKLGHYRIGEYPAPLRNLDVYTAPKGFIEVPKALEGIKVSPHFTLGQFLCKQQSAYPKYLVLRPKLVAKLEFLLKEVNDKGIHTDSFVIMSGYRTPYYNKAIGNVASSRHIYGGAADFYIDTHPKDGVMDDLNKDGRVTIEDASVLYAIADEFVKKTGKTELTGGVGLYKATEAHGPFVHIDVRGSRARW